MNLDKAVNQTLHNTATQNKNCSSQILETVAVKFSANLRNPFCAGQENLKPNCTASVT